MDIAIPQSWRDFGARALDVALAALIYLAAGIGALTIIVLACVIRALPLIVVLACGLLLFSCFGVI